VALGLVLVVVGCGSSKSSLVTVSGTLGWTGGVVGPRGPIGHVMPGTVTLKSAAGTTVVTADSHGHFSTRVRRGTYVVTGTSPNFISNGVRVTCTVAGGPVDASRDRAGILVLCEGT